MSVNQLKVISYAVPFLLAKFCHFSTKKLGFSVNSTNFTNFLVTFRQIFDIKKGKYKLLQLLEIASVLQLFLGIDNLERVMWSIIGRGLTIPYCNFLL
jgi:hypothetical protein